MVVKASHLLGARVHWANDLVRYFVREILYPKNHSWSRHPQFKVIIANNLVDILEENGFWWQAERIRNHLHRWMASCKAGGLDTLSRRERRFH